MSWQPSLGAWPEDAGVRFRVWAPEARHLETIVERANGEKSVFSLQKDSEGMYAGLIQGLKPGDQYRYCPQNKGSFPDPASRFQPQGVHGPSEIVDFKQFTWSDAGWKGVPLERLIIYELHVGTFTPEGTFAGATERLPYLADLGITTVELMPLADFPGRWNWGYDGVDLFAPAHCYGKPDDLRRFVDRAHRHGIAVLIDVVYNHLGPDGNYLGVYSPFYFSRRHHTAWGQALNFDGEHNERVREFFVQNALHWIHEYHADGLRLDATHAIQDDSSRKFMAELADRVHGSVSDRTVVLIAEDHRNLAAMLKPESEGGWGLDGLWADDFHHQLRRLLAGDNESYYQDFAGSVHDLATTIGQGWLFTGQFSKHLNQPRGTDPTGIPPSRLIYCLQNHDQIGNRALGERLNQQIDSAAFRAASVLLFCVPETPLLFMGQEWAADTPFLFFADHHAELGRRVSEGRLQEFRHFRAFADTEFRGRIPDPQSPATFAASRLNWAERDRPEHAAIEHLYRALIRLRRTAPALDSATKQALSVQPVADGGILLCRGTVDGPKLLIAVQLRGAGSIAIADGDMAPDQNWQPLLCTEEGAYCTDPHPARIDRGKGLPIIHFQRPGAMILSVEERGAPDR